MKSFRIAQLFLALAVIADAQPRLVNLSTRAQAGTGSAVLTAGFVVSGGSKQVLVRAVGPTLGAAPFNIAGVLADPVLTIVDSNGTTVATNDNWNAADAATFTAVGAFALRAGSTDAAIVTTLQPGGYTAQVTDKTGGTGIALVEVYEVNAQGGRLVNISTRAQVGAGSSVMIPGIVVSAGSGTRRFLIRAAGPALAAFGLSGTLADPIVTLTTQTGTPLATNNDWGTPVGTGAFDAATLATAATLAGAFPLATGSKDAALLVDLAPGSYGIQVSGAAGATGLALVEVYDLTPATPPTVTVIASDATADTSGSNFGEYTFTRTGDTLEALTVNYSVSGSATNGIDYPFLQGTIVIPAGASSTKVSLSPNPSVQNGGTKTAIVSVTTGAGYTPGAGSATVNIAYVPATLYLATLRPPTSVTGSTASGTATILLSQSGTLASVNVSFSNLSSTETSAHLMITPADDYVLALAPGQVEGQQWLFSPTGTYTTTALLNALKSGNISVRIDSANYQSGEVRGAFVQAAGAQTFTPPAAPPAVTLTNVTATDAARLLTQATFGPKRSEIDALTGGSIDAWITAQEAMPFTSHRAAMLADQATYGGSGSFTNWNALNYQNRQAAWWKNSLTAPDQLRQRVAFALAQIFVISDVSLGNDNQAEPIANYYDILGNGAFGSFRTLLENVTLNPMMGEYLTWVRNPKGDPNTGQTPDENYAREIMQLFTIGLNMLNPDGTLQLDANGLPIPTYLQPTVTEMAKVFTGWSYFGTSNFYSGGNNLAGMTNPMILFPAYHDTSDKKLSLTDLQVIPANSANTAGTSDLKAALDALAYHPNTGPFICKQLIQRLVTSNPSPAYVYRVAQVWQNDGTGAVGNLGAVVRAILEDYEARSPTIAATATFGKLREPILRVTALLRSFNASSTSGRYIGFQNTANGTPINGTTPKPALATDIGTLSSTRYDNVQNNLDQAAEHSPTVFNFYHPGYVLPGALASAGLVAPEFEITDSTFSVDVPNLLRTVVLTTASGAGAAYALVPDFTTEATLASTYATDPSALLNHLNLVLCGGSMSAATRQSVTQSLKTLPAGTSAFEAARTAVMLLSTTSAGAVQR